MYGRFISQCNDLILCSFIDILRLNDGGIKDDVVIALELAVYYSARPEMYK
jgi:hypothetical protein